MKSTDFKPISINIDLEDIGKKIRVFREKRGLTQEELANKISETCNARTISQYELGVSEMGMRRFMGICVVLEITLNDLLPEDMSPIVKNSSNSCLKCKLLNDIYRPIIDYVINAFYLKQNQDMRKK